MFVTKLARNIVEAGGSLRDGQRNREWRPKMCFTVQTANKEDPRIQGHPWYPVGRHPELFTIPADDRVVGRH
jgi:hypothetical protein